MLGREPSKGRATRDEETLEVRVRTKNPLIERTPSRRRDTDTKVETPDLDGQVVPKRAPHAPEPSAVERGVIEPGAKSPRRGPSTIDASTVEGGVSEPRAKSPRRHPPPDALPREEYEDEETVLDAPVDASHKPAPRQRLGDVGRHPSTRKPRRDPAHALTEGANPLTEVRKVLSAEIQEKLDAIFAGAFERPSMDGSNSPKRALEHLALDEPFRRLSLEEQGMLLTAAARQPEDLATIKSAIAILKSGHVHALPMPYRWRVLGLFEDLDPIARTLLARFSARTTVGGEPAIRSHDEDAGWVVDHLAGIARDERVWARERAGAPSPDARTGPRPRPSKRGEEATQGPPPTAFTRAVLTHLAHPQAMPLEEGPEGHFLAVEFALAFQSPALFARLAREALNTDLRHGESAGPSPSPGAWEQGHSQEGPERVPAAALLARTAPDHKGAPEKDGASRRPQRRPHAKSAAESEARLSFTKPIRALLRSMAEPSSATGFALGAGVGDSAAGAAGHAASMPRGESMADTSSFAKVEAVVDPEDVKVVVSSPDGADGRARAQHPGGIGEGPFAQALGRPGLAREGTAAVRELGRLGKRGKAAGYRGPVEPAEAGLPATVRRKELRDHTDEADVQATGNLAKACEAVARALTSIHRVDYGVQRGRAAFGRLADRSWSEETLTPTFVSLRHARGDRLFLVDRLDDEWLYVYAPHGRSTKREGGTREAPRRHVVDPDTGLERVPVADLSAHTATIVRPKR